MIRFILFLFITLTARADYDPYYPTIGSIHNVDGKVSLPGNASRESGGHLQSIDAKLTNPLPVSVVSPLPVSFPTPVQVNGLITSSSAAVTTSGSVALTSVQIVGSNANRKGFVLWNNSANSAYVSFAATSASSTPTYIVPTFTSLVFINTVVYTGPISAIRNAGSGTMTIYELQ